MLVKLDGEAMPLIQIALITIYFAFGDFVYGKVSWLCHMWIFFLLFLFCWQNTEKMCSLMSFPV